MALTIKQLNGDASFLLTFQRVDTDSPSGGSTSPRDSFRILLDPCLAPSPVAASTRCACPSETCVRQGSLTPKDVPESDVIIISNSRSANCNEATLRKFARGGAKPLILAMPPAAKAIQGWRCFDQDRVTTLHRWRDPRHTGQSNVVRIPIPAAVIGGEEGLVTVAVITQKREKRELGSAIGITYRPPSSARSLLPRPVSTAIMPNNRRESAQLFLLNSPTLPPLPAFSPLAPPAVSMTQSIRSTRSMASLSSPVQNRGVSIIFAPHGIPYRDIEPYATSHLLAEAALPLTVLLHSFDTISRPWWLGGTLTSGFEDGKDIMVKLGAKVWISACEAEKNVNGLARRFIRRRTYTRDEVRRLVHGPLESQDTDCSGPLSGRSQKATTEVLALEVGEDVTVTSEGVLPADPSVDDDRKRRPSSIRRLSAADVVVPGPLAGKATTTRRLARRGPAAVAVA